MRAVIYMLHCTSRLLMALLRCNMYHGCCCCSNSLWPLLLLLLLLLLPYILFPPSAAAGTSEHEAKKMSEGRF
jgi:hypothetical protein